MSQLVRWHAEEFEKFADLLDIAVVNLKEAGCAVELLEGTFYTCFQMKLSKLTLTQYRRWRPEQQNPEHLYLCLSGSTWKHPFTLQQRNYWSNWRKCSSAKVAPNNQATLERLRQPWETTYHSFVATADQSDLPGVLPVLTARVIIKFGHAKILRRAVLNNAWNRLRSSTYVIAV